MITTMWKHVSYKKMGISHQGEGIDCQDSVRIHEDGACIVAALADGLGSLKYSALASMTATDTACQWLSSANQDDLFLDTKAKEDLFRNAFSAAISDAVRGVAQSNGVKPKSMDCTLAFVFISKIHDFALAGMIGDSAVCIITENTSIALTDSGSFSNGTRAVQDSDAGEHMLLSRFDLQKDQVIGFILTSDGLDNEIYIKGSKHVNQAAEEYFNALMEPDPVREIEQIIADLTDYEDTPFDDDISIAIVSRAAEKIQLDTDPSWLCTCGCRNVLQNTYCVSCNQDFTKLYSNVRFREHGGKAAFFKKINEHPDEERKLIGLPPIENAALVISPSEQNDAGEENLNNGSEQPTTPAMTTDEHSGLDRHHRLGKKIISTPLVLAAAALLAVGSIAGMVVGRLSSGRKIDDLLNDVLTLRKDLVAKTQQLEELQAQMDGEYPDDFCVLEDGSYYWGQLDENTPNGNGLLLMDGDYYIGEFVDGLRDGVFTVIPDGDSVKCETVTYSMGELQTDVPLQEVQYVVTEDRINVRDNPGIIETAVIGQKSSGDVVIGTGEVRLVGDTVWAEIQWEDGMTAWMLFSKLSKQEAEPEQENDLTQEAEPEQENDLTQEAEPETAVYVVIPQKLNVRNQPGQEGTQIIGELHKGDPVTLTGAEQEVGKSVWVEIVWDDRTAWVSSRQLEKQP